MLMYIIKLHYNYFKVVINYKQQQNNYECHQSEPPEKGYEEDFCDYQWEQFYNWAKEIGYTNTARKVDQLHILADFGYGNIGKTVCYQKENYMTKGWCRTHNWGKESDWGICSESCKYLKDIAEGSFGIGYKVCKLSLSSSFDVIS